MNILEQIVAHKKKEVATRRTKFPLAWLQSQVGFARQCYSLTDALKASPHGIIAEFKRKSPSRGFINEFADVKRITKGYAKEGAAALSILTDEKFFGGSSEDLFAARENLLPILRKDFVIDPYQVYETKSMGADAILLIAACLSPQQVSDLAALARSLGLQVLLEIHDAEELKHICDGVSLTGINNRNLRDFTINLNSSLQLASALPPSMLRISESGISDEEVIERFRNAGFSGFLIGELFMRAADPVQAFHHFVNRILNDQH